MTHFSQVLFAYSASNLTRNKKVTSRKLPPQKPTTYKKSAKRLKKKWMYSLAKHIRCKDLNGVMDLLSFSAYRAKRFKYNGQQHWSATKWRKSSTSPMQLAVRNPHLPILKLLMRSKGTGVFAFDKKNRLPFEVSLMVRDVDFECTAFVVGEYIKLNF